MARHLHRYREIATVLTRHGLYATAVQAGLGRWAPSVEGIDHESGGPELLVSAFEELGAAFVKLGQLISTRPDIFPEEYCAAFAKLTDSSIPVPFDELEAVIEADLVTSVDEAYAWFDRVPVAAASIGQVHRARLHDGRRVVVKIRRPGVAAEVHEDLDILRNLANRLVRTSQTLADMDFVRLVDEFSASLRAELDYVVEARACEEIGTSFQDDPSVNIPWIHWQNTTPRVLTMEELSGVRIDDLEALEEAGIDRPALAKRSADVFIRMVFEDGVFHADPHAGNLFVEDDGTIGIIDFGSVGRINEGMRRQFAKMMLAFVKGNPDAIVRALLEIAPSGSLDRSLLRSDVAKMTDRLDGSTLAEVRVDQLGSELFAIVRRHRLSLPPELVQLFRMLTIADGLGRKIDPEFDINGALAPFAERLVQQRMDPFAWAGRLKDVASSAAEFGIDLPDFARKLVDRIDSGTLDVHIRASELDPMVARLERTGDRLVAALIVGSMITGGTNILVAYKNQLGKIVGPAIAAGGAALTGGSAYIAWTSRPRRRR